MLLWFKIWFQTYWRHLAHFHMLCYPEFTENGALTKKKNRSSKESVHNKYAQEWLCRSGFQCLCHVCVSGPTFMPKVITVTIILKTKARANCHRAVYRPSPAGRSARLLPTPVSDVLAGWNECVGRTEAGKDKQREDIEEIEGSRTEKQKTTYLKG